MHKRKECGKLIEVVWKREDGCNSREPNDSPELKEIDLEDTVKKPVKSKSSSHAKRINKKNDKCAHKPVRRSLFPESKIGKLIKHFDVNKFDEKHLGLRQSSRLKFSNAVSNEEKARQNQSTSNHQLNQFSFQKVLSNTDVHGPSIIKSSGTTEGEIVSHTRDLNHSEILDVSNKKFNYDNNNLDKKNFSDKNKLADINYSRKRSNYIISKVSQILPCSNSSTIMCDPKKNITNLNTSMNKLNRQQFQTSKLFEPLDPHTIEVDCQSKSPEIMSNQKRYNEHDKSLDKTNVSTYEHLNVTRNMPNKSNHKCCDPLISSKKKSDSLPKASKILACPKSPIISSKNKIKRYIETSFCESKLYPFRATKDLKTESSVPKTSIVECSTYNQKQINLPPRTLNVVRKSKSPEIVSSRKQSYGVVGSLDNMNLFKQDNLKVTTNMPNKSNNKSCDLLKNATKRSDSLPDTSQILSCPKSPIIVSKKIIKTDKEASFSESKTSKTTNNLKTESSAHETYIVKCSTHSQNQINPPTLDVRNLKSPEIVSSRKRSYVHDSSLDKTKVFKYDNLNVTMNMLNESLHKSCDSLISSYKMSDSLSKRSQISCGPKSPIISSKKKIKRDPEVLFCESMLHPSKTANILKTELSSQILVHDTRVIKSSNTSKNDKVPCASDLKLNKSPEIKAKRECNSHVARKSNDDKLNTNSINTDKSNTNCNHPVENKLKNKCNNLSEAPNVLHCSGPLQIISNRKKMMTEKNSCLPTSKRCLLPIMENSKAVELLHSRSGNDELVVNAPNTVQNQVKPPTQKERGKHKSPEIVTNRKFHTGNNIFDKFNIPEIDKSDANILNNNYCELENGVSSPKKRRPSISEASQLVPYSKVPQIVPNREKINLIQNTRVLKSKRRLFQTAQSQKIVEILPPSTVRVPSVEPPNLVNQEVVKSKSSEINSNFKFNLENTNVSNYDNCDMNKLKLAVQASVNSNGKSETNVNTYSNNVQLKSNSVHSEDIVESSEIICEKQPKRKSKKNKIHLHKKPKSKQRVCKKQNDEPMPFVDIPEINVQGNEFKSKTEILETNKNEVCSESVNSSHIDIIHSENVVKSPFIESKIKSSRKKVKNSTIKFQDDQNSVSTDSKPNDIQVCPVPPLLLGSKKSINNSVKDNLNMLKPHKNECLIKNKNKNCVKSDVTSTEINVIPATPERNVVNVDKQAIENFSETLENLSIPLIEVDKSPQTPNGKNQHPALIQSVYSPPNGESLPGLFEAVISPTQCPINIQSDTVLPFKIDSIVSPATVAYNNSLLSPELCRKKISNSSPSPNHFDSAKKRKKVGKDGLRGKFRELISRKKSEARIREYEKTMSKNYQPKQEDGSVLLSVIELWKEFNSFVLLCYHRKSETEVQKVLVTLDNCPKNVIKDSIIRIYSPWSTIESKILDLLMYVGVIHIEVIESPGPSRHLGPSELFPNFNGLLSTMYQSEVLWKCKCSKDAACQCLDELSAYNYIQYMVSHPGL